MDLTWQQVYDNALERFGGLAPTRQLEADLVEIFEHRPDTIRAAINRAADLYATGKAHSPWGIVHAELERDARRADITADQSGPDRERAIRLAETYTRNAGLYNPSVTSHLDDLFGDRGLLHPWAHDQQLRDRMATFWESQQPRAEQAERDVTTRAERWKATRALRDQPAPATTIDDELFTP